MHEYTLGREEETRYITGLDPATHIRAPDGRIEVSIRTVVVATFAISGFRQQTDLVQINVR